MKDHPPLPERVPYPLAPWHLAGRMWAGLFRAEGPLDLPQDLRPLLSSRTVGVSVFRYEQGTLRYDELLVAVPVRCGLRLGLWVYDLWVSDAAALWGGRDIWRLPKHMAEFHWQEDQVSVEDRGGLVANIRLESRRRGLPWCWLPVPIIGGSTGCRCFARAGWRGRLGVPRLSVAQWSPRFSFRIAGKPSLGFASDGFRMVVPAPHCVKAPVQS